MEGVDKNMSDYIIKISKLDNMYETITGRYFKCTLDEFNRHICNFNLKRGRARTKRLSLNTWLEEIGLSCIEIGDDLVWPSAKEIGWLDIQYEILWSDNNIPVVVLVYANVPIWNLK
jgi:hypothetical protein